MISDKIRSDAMQRNVCFLPVDRALLSTRPFPLHRQFPAQDVWQICLYHLQACVDTVVRRFSRKKVRKPFSGSAGPVICHYASESRPSESSANSITGSICCSLGPTVKFGVCPTDDRAQAREASGLARTALRWLSIARRSR